MTKWLIIILGCWLFLLILAYLFQRKMIYFPPPISFQSLSEQAKKFGFEPWTATNSNNAYGFISKPQSPKGTLVFYHGNAEHVLGSLPLALGFDQTQWTLALHEYPGYSGIPGPPAEHRLTRFASEAINHLDSPGPLILVGRSLGSGVSLAISQEVQPDGLILISPFSRFIDIAKHYYRYLLPQLILRERWDNLSALSKLSCPILVLHGVNDNIIPIKFGKTLYDAYAGPKEFVELKGVGHNDIPIEDPNSLFWTKIHAFMDQFKK